MGPCNELDSPLPVTAGDAEPPTEGGGGVQLPGGQVGPGEVAALVVVVLDVERAQL